MKPALAPRSAACAMAVLALAAGALLPTLTQAQTGKQAWTQAAVSPGLHSLGQAMSVTYRPANAVPPGAVITAVYADRDYFGQADVQTSLCWGGPQHCVDIVGRSINSRAFKGLDARQPMLLVHRVRAWNGSHRPLYIKGNVTVWYGPPPSEHTTQ